MTHHMLAASGYLTIFLPFALLIAGQALDAPYLAVAIVFGLGPLSRLILGNVPDELPEWEESTSTLLDRLPSAFALAFPVLMTWFLSELHATRPSDPGDWIWLGLSVWTCLFFSVVVAHELIHQAGYRRRLGWLLAGAAGYPWLAHEHLPHHGTSGNVDLAEWPRRDESLWSFVVRRTFRVVRSAREFNAILGARKGRSPWYGGLLEALAATAGMSLAFFGLQACQACCFTCVLPPASTSAFRRSPISSTGDSAWTVFNARMRVASHGRTAANSKFG